MPDPIFDELVAHLDAVPAAPFLFVGSGLSRRYLGLEDWKDLLRSFAEDMGLDFQRELASVNGDMPAVGHVIAEQFYDHWWNADAYEEQRLRWSDHVERREHPLKIAVAEKMQTLSADFDYVGSEFEAEIGALRSVQIDGVITTNWDLILEQVFPDFKPFIGQEQLLFGSSQGVGEIYKIHGCCSQPKSLVLTSADYERFAGRNPYLSARLLSTFVDHPVVFLGYRIGDPNIQAILASIVDCLDAENLARLQNRLIFIGRANGDHPTISRQDQHFGSLRLPVLVVKTDDFASVYRALAVKERKVPARILRFLKEQVYELVLGSEPTESMFVQDIETGTDTAEIDLVLGVGVRDKLRAAEVGEQGYRPISRTDLLRDVIDGLGRYDPEKIVTERLSTFLIGNALVPCFGYLAAAGHRFENGAWEPPVPEKVDSWTRTVGLRLQPATGGYTSYRRMASDHQASGGTLADLPSDVRLRELALARFLSLDSFAVDELLQFLQARAEESLAADADASCRSQFAALVCIYDLLRFAPACGMSVHDASDTSTVADIPLADQ